MTSLAAMAAGYARPPAKDVWTEPRTGMVFALVPAGRFLMGSPESERYREVQEVRHEVTISRPFFLGAFEVTQQQWRAVMATTPSWFGGGGRRPVENVNWFEVQDFLRRMTAASGDGVFRLPTEAEWEYACRAGTTTAYHLGTSLTADQAMVDPRSSEDATGAPGTGGPARVGAFAPNPWGLHDMHGNVWEWTADPHCDYPATGTTDPRPACSGPRKVIRGGSWYFRADSARCASRYTHRPQDRGFSLGFRVLREIGPR